MRPARARLASRIALAFLAASGPAIALADTTPVDSRRNPTEMPESIRQVLEQADLRKLLATADHDKVLDWLQERSLQIVLAVEAKEYNSRAVCMAHWSPDGLLDFYNEFRDRFPHLTRYTYYYAEWHQGFLKRKAKERGLWHEKYEQPLRLPSPPAAK